MKGALVETGQIASQQWKTTGGEDVYFKDSAELWIQGELWEGIFRIFR